ncbi:response regulator [Anaeromicrobium sediminis]|uniref:Stage 0 sporulation protein A homolog n=1 Tax=Anaeromicrobium sediminis TaxID=1478221 RepID=A0A267MPJ1_9FIRM|nr:response regulator [Anaeromicrobium sediminis]PAB60713.1 hypothetical protein CCE28_04015 [Anaeromicrobium sediminis]
MEFSIYIVDDDENIRAILKKVIRDNKLGYVIGESSDGIHGIENIIDLKPNIVLVDLLLPKCDGITIVDKVTSMNRDISFIMISQVDSPNMVGEAYKKNIEFFIHKPINQIEVISIINKVKGNIKMKKIVNSLEKTLHSIMDLKGNDEFGSHKKNKKHKGEKILLELGIIGEAGSNDIIEIINMLMEKNEMNINTISNKKVYEIYDMLKNRYKNLYEKELSIGAFEQRIRRAVGKGLKNIANLGLEDYANDIYMKYSNSLFDFSEVRREMNYIKGKSTHPGKINIKKFIDGIVIEVLNEL